MSDQVLQLFNKAVTAYSSQDYAKAGDTCAKALDIQADHAPTMYLSGLCQSRNGSPNAGGKIIDEALRLDPHIGDFDFLRERLIHQGIEDPIVHWEERFVQYLRFFQLDAFILSYPKCGRTWLRMLLGLYVMGENGDGDPLEILGLTQSKPDFATLEMSHDDFPHIKPYDMMSTNKKAYQGKKVVLLVRDPRDVVVSYYFQYTLRGDKKSAKDESFDGTMSDFLFHNIGGLPSIVRFYNTWAENKDVPGDFLLLTYEDMKSDAAGALATTARFLGWPERAPGFVEQVVEFSRFENMRKLEESNALNNVRLRPPKDGNPEGFKVRKGKVGGYREYFSDQEIAEIDAYIDTHLSDFYAMYKTSA